MQPLKFVIGGEFWDSHVYSGKLFLFGMEGEIKTLDWESLVRSLPVSKPTRLALVCAFLRSDYLYGSEVRELLEDHEVRTLIRKKFKRLADEELIASTQRLARHSLGEQDNPCPFPHSDCEIYYKNLYTVGPSGVFRATASGRTKYPVSTRPEKVWDGPVLGVSASWGSLALAAGNEGLFEQSVSRSYWLPSGERYREPRPVIEQDCRDCNWVFHSVFASSSLGGFLADYEKVDVAEAEATQRRVLRSVIPAEQLFAHPGYSWGVQDKLCSAVPEGISVVRYQPWRREDESPFTPLGTVETEPWKGQVVSASVAPFGVVVEMDHALIVFPSAGPAVTLSGEPVNWRVFPRSKHYENQLHVVYADRLEVLSFNQDYLVDQEDKRLGVSVFSRQSRERLLKER